MREIDDENPKHGLTNKKEACTTEYVHFYAFHANTLISSKRLSRLSHL